MKLDLTGLEKVVPEKFKFRNGVFIVGTPTTSHKYRELYYNDKLFEYEYPNVKYTNKENKK